MLIGATSNLTFLQDYPFDICMNLASALLIGYAVVRFRLLEIRVILVRSLFYSVLTVGGFAAYLGIVFGMERILKLGIGYSGPLYPIIAILVIAIVFLPFRNGLLKGWTGSSSGRKPDYQNVTQVFSRDITTLYGDTEVFDLVAETVTKTVRVEGLSIALLDDERKAFVVAKTTGAAELVGEAVMSEQSALARWLLAEGTPILREESATRPELRALVKENRLLFERADVSAVIPMVLKDRVIGTLNLGPKSAGSMYSDEDLRFLNTIANQTAAAIEKSTIFGEMQRRLSEQTLLFILSERFRSTADFDSVMLSLVQILKSFLNCDVCALIFHGKEGTAKSYALDPVSGAAAELASGFRARIEADAAARKDVFPIARAEIAALARGKSGIGEDLAGRIASLVYFPLQSGDESLGMLVLSNRGKRETIDAERVRAPPHHRSDPLPGHRSAPHDPEPHQRENLQREHPQQLERHGGQPRDPGRQRRHQEREQGDMHHARLLGRGTGRKARDGDRGA